MITVNFAAIRRREKTETTIINNNKKNSEVANYSSVNLIAYI